MINIQSIMPKIFEYFGFIFFFYSNEHEPIHVHVVKAECESIFELIINNGQLIKITRRSVDRLSLSEKDAKIAENFIKKYYRNIIEKWIKFFVLKKAIRSTRITKKI